MLLLCSSQEEDLPTKWISNFDFMDISTFLQEEIVDEMYSNKPTVPRSYQVTIFKKATSGNVIAVLDTGSGKTLISALLIKHVHNTEYAQGKSRRITIFLVPKVPLVSQQTKYLKSNLNLVVKAYYGQMNVDRWPDQKWKDEFITVDVMVLTPDIFKYLLDKALLEMKDLNLIVFDEAHHSRKNHCYKQIMGLHYIRAALNDRPKIFGMTASPTLSKENTQESVLILERNLHAKAYTCHTTQYVSKPKEFVKFYEKGPQFQIPKLYNALMDNDASMVPILKKALRQSVTLCEELGTWCAERALEMAIHDVSKKLKYTSYRSFLVDSILGHTDASLSEKSTQDLLETRQQLEDNIAKLELYISTSPRLGESTPMPKESDLSHKIRALFDVLRKFKQAGNRFCGIVFCRRRWTACVLSLLFKYWDEFDWIRPGLMVGQGSAPHSMSYMTLHNQEQVMNDFRSGKINLLFATQVAEEGLDIQSCILVIRFDMFTNLAAYIQSRGRARQRESLFVVLSNKDCPEEASMLYSMQLEEKKMRQILYEDRMQPLDDSIKDPYSVNDDEIFRIEATNACVSLQSSISLLYNYCASLPNDGLQRLRPEFFDDSIVIPMENQLNSMKCLCTLKLPLNVPLDCRVIISKPADSLKKARQWAAFEAIQRLYKVGELDDRLRPIRPELPKVAQATKKQKNALFHECEYTNPLLFGRHWSNETRASIHFVSLKEAGNEFKAFTVGLLTSIETQIPELKCTFKMENEDAEFKVLPIQGLVQLNQERLELVRSFHYALFSSVLRSKFTRNSDFTVMVVPINENAISAGDAVDWTLLTALANSPSESLDVLLSRNYFKEKVIDLCDLVLYDSVHYKRRYFVDDIRTDIHPFTEMPQLPGLGRHKSAADFYKFRLKYSGDIHEQQPIILVKPVHVPLLTVSTVYHDRNPTLVIPQFCTIHPIPARIMRYEAIRLPLMLYHLHHHLHALEIKKGWNISTSIDINHSFTTNAIELPASVDSLKMALTAPSTELSYDYERLETLGDSYLKFHLSLHFFSMHPTRHEGWLTLARHELERNSHLYTLGLEHHVEGSILLHKMKRSEWFPPILKDRIRTQYLPEKCIADVVEAIIGACVVDGHEHGGAVAINRFFGSEYKIEFNEYHESYINWRLSKISKRNSLWILQSKRMIDSVENIIGYEFKDKLHILDAMTHPSAILDSDRSCYQRLEYLGDAVLGYLMTKFLFKEFPWMQPHQLSEIRSGLVNNQFLATASCSLNLHTHIEHLSTPLARALMQFTNALDSHLGLSSSDFIPQDRKRRKTMQFYNNSIECILEDGPSTTLMKDSTSREEILGNENHKRIQSDCTDYKLDSMQNLKLEELNVDASVDASANALVDVKQETANVKQETADVHVLVDDNEPLDISSDDDNVIDLVKEEMNETTECRGFKRTLEDDDDIFEIEPMNEKKPRKCIESKPLFWEEMETAPKAASDVLEALFGAIYVDSHFDINAVWKAIDKVLIQRWYHRFKESIELNKGSLETNPISKFLSLINKEFECKKVQIEIKEDIHYECIVYFHEETIAISRGTCRKYSKKLACTMATHYIKENLKRMKKMCQCPGLDNAKVALEQSHEPIEILDE